VADRRPSTGPGARHAAAALLLAGTAVAGCDTVTACPAIGYDNTLTVALAEGWPPGTGRTVPVDCAGPCDVERLEDGTLAAEACAPLIGASASLPFTVTFPESVVVTVRDAAGTELARVATDPDWARVGGTEECGGPNEATVTVPAP